MLELAREAHSQYRWDDAYHHYCAAAEDGDLEIDDLAALADAAWWLGHTDESLALSEKVYRQHLQGERVPRAAWLAIRMGCLWLMRGETTVGSGWISRARHLLEDTPESAAHGYLHYLNIEEALGAGRFEEAIDLSRWVRELATRYDDPTLSAVGLVLEGAAEVRRGRLEVGLAVIDEAMLAVRAGEVLPDWAGNLYCHVIDLCIDLADLHRARAWTTATERWCDQHSSAAMFVGICRLHRAQLLQLEGAWQAAEQQAAQVCDDLADMNVGVVAEGHYQIAESWRRRGDHTTAEEAYVRAQELGRDPQPGLALLRLAQGQGRTASRALHTALAALDQPLDRAPLLVAQVEVATACSEVGVAGRATEELVQIADTFNTPGLLAYARQATGIARLASGEPARALPVLRDAWRRWRDLEARYDAGRMRARLAETLATVGDTEGAAREVELARAEFDALGAKDDLAALDGVIGRAEPSLGLSAREVEVLRCVCLGHSNREIGTALSISEKTVARHLSNIFVKLDVGSRTEAAAVAFSHGVANGPVARR